MPFAPRTVPPMGGAELRVSSRQKVLWLFADGGRGGDLLVPLASWATSASAASRWAPYF